MDDLESSVSASDPFLATDWAVSIQVGEALWRARSRMGLSLEDVACRAGVAPRLLGVIEDSAFDRMPSRDVVIATARAYARIVHLPRRWVARTLARILI